MSPYPLPTSYQAPPRLPVRKVSSLVILRPKSEFPPLAAHQLTPQSNTLLPLPSVSSALNPIMSPAIVAARKAAGFSTRPYPLASLSALPKRPRPAPSVPLTRNWSDPSSFSLPTERTNNGIPKRAVVDDSRWEFKCEDDLPEPRPLQGVKKIYRSGGKGNNIPLDLKTLN